MVNRLWFVHPYGCNAPDVIHTVDSGFQWWRFCIRSNSPSEKNWPHFCRFYCSKIPCPRDQTTPSNFVSISRTARGQHRTSPNYRWLIILHHYQHSLFDIPLAYYTIIYLYNIFTKNHDNFRWWTKPNLSKRNLE